MPTFTLLSPHEVELFIWLAKVALYVIVTAGLVYIALCLKEKSK